MRASTLLFVACVALLACASVVLAEENTVKEPLVSSANAPKTAANGPVAQSARLESLRARFGFQPQASCASGKYACADGSGCCNYGTTCGTASTCGAAYCCSGGGPSYCFAADSLVTRQSESGSAVRVPLSSVRAGDLLLSIDEQGLSTFEPVLYLSHTLDNKESAPMRSISVKDVSEAIVASHDHMLFVQKAGQTASLSLLSDNLVAAESVQVGDRIAVSVCSVESASVCVESTLAWSEVSAVSDVTVTGLQNAWTASGRVLVSDVLVSPFRTSTLATYKGVLSTVANVLTSVGVSESKAQSVAHSVYTTYLAVFRQTKPVALTHTNDLVYVAGLLLAAAGAVKVAQKIVA